MEEESRSGWPRGTVGGGLRGDTRGGAPRSRTCDNGASVRSLVAILLLSYGGSDPRGRLGEGPGERDGPPSLQAGKLNCASHLYVRDSV